jgi:HAD superfamily hydrolase (TIGR01509 family)
MVKRYIIFDLDGVLVDTNEIHRDCFIEAWNSVNTTFPLNIQIHDAVLNGYTSVDKICYLDKHFGIRSDVRRITTIKSENTNVRISNQVYSDKVHTIMKTLKAHGFVIGCASNLDRHLLELVLKKLNIINMLDSIVSKQDVSFPKPSPDCYIKTMKNFKCIPEDTLIFEDSDVGIEAARASGGRVCVVSNPDCLTIDFIMNHIYQ